MIANRTNDARRADTSSPAERVLAQAQAGREVVQEFVRLADSLEWELVLLINLVSKFPKEKEIEPQRHRDTE